MISSQSFLIILLVILLLSNGTYAFGAGNIASIAKIEGHNWRHGDIEDILKTIAFIKHHKWTTMMIKRVYFGNWLRDYSQAVDVGSLKGVPAETVRILVWILSFMSFGYATEEFEVTSERLGVYRPEEHIDNPKDYADNEDARKYDPRLRGPVMPEELAIDPMTGMKNYIANDVGQWATSLGYVKHSFARSIHFGRVYTSGAAGTSGKQADLCEALRCLGQGLHCLEDFAAHTNYIELSLREMGYTNVFPHVGEATQIYLGGRPVFPLVTGTFGGVDFLHSVLGEATDHVTQSEVDEMKKALENASAAKATAGSSPEARVAGVTNLLSQIPGTSGLCQEAVNLQRASDQQAAQNANATGSVSGYNTQSAPSFPPPPSGSGTNYSEYNPQSAPQAAPSFSPPPAGSGPSYSEYNTPATSQGAQNFSAPPTISDSGYSVYNAQSNLQTTPNFPPPLPISELGYSGNNAQSTSQATPYFPPPPTASGSGYSGTNTQSGSQLPPYFPPPPTTAGPGSGYSGNNTQSGFQAPLNFPPPPTVPGSGYSSNNPQSTPSFAPPPTVDPQAVVQKIYPILAFRDKVVRAISSVITVIPGLESLVDKIQESVTLFIMSLLAPYVQPLIDLASKQLKTGSTTVIDASGRHQYEPWTDPYCTDPTHSLLSKDHFSNVLNEPAGQVASEILKYCAPRVLFAWQNPAISLDQVLDDIAQVFHHPAIRNQQLELHRNMFGAVERWAQSQNNQTTNLNILLSSESVKNGRNHVGGHNDEASAAQQKLFGLGSHSKVSGSPFAMLSGDTKTGGALQDFDQSHDPHMSWSQASNAQQTIDYTPSDPTTYSTAYSQGLTGQQPQFVPNSEPPPPSYSESLQWNNSGYGATSWNANPQQSTYNNPNQSVGGYGGPQGGYSTNTSNPPPSQQGFNQY